MYKKKSLAVLRPGGPGNDNYLVTDPTDVIAEGVGQGYDTVYTTVGYSLAAGSEIEVLTVYDRDTVNTIDLNGNEFANVIYGNQGRNSLHGGGGADVFYGLGGDDSYIVDSASDVVNEAVGQGYDTVYTTVSYTLAAGSEVEVLTVYDRDTVNALNLAGNEFANIIYGNQANNAFLGGGGADTFYGLGGDDSYIVDSASDVVYEAAGKGYDTVYATATYGLLAGSEIEVLTVYDRDTVYALDLGGNEFGNTIYGNQGRNVMYGGGGTDAFYGLGGDDSYVVDSADDAVNEAVGQGYDTLYTTVSYTLAAGSEIEALTVYDRDTTGAINLTGNAFANAIYGNAGSNVLNGGGGNDMLFGGNGADTYIVDAGDSVFEDAPGWAFPDTVLATTSFTLGAGQQVEILSVFDPASLAAINLTGNEFTQELRGGAGNNVLTGHAQGTKFFGGLGADTLDSAGFINSYYYFDTALGGGNIDFIPHLNGTIMLAGDAGSPFSILATGQLGANTFIVGPAAADANDFLIYNPATGALLFDADGNGAGAAVQFATLETNLSGLNSGLFTVVGAPNHAPTISSGATASVAENAPTSTIVYQVAAADSDGDRIFYQLTGADADRLTVDATGAVRLITSADYEAKTSYSFTVLASDSSGSSASRAVTLTVTNVDDSPTTPIIPETSSPNDAIGQAQTLNRGIFTTSPNPNLFDDDLPSATITGSVSAPGDKDFFSITLQAGELLVLDVDGTSGGLDSFLTLYGPNLQVIGDNDDLVTFDPGSNPPFGHNTDSQIRFRAGSTGTYYFSIESFSDDAGPTSSGSYQLHVSVGPQATPQQLIQEDVEAMLGGTSWNHLNLTYGFPTSASQYPASFTEPDDGFLPFTGAQQGATRLLLQLVANVTPLTFAELTANPGQADLRYAMSNEPEVAYAYYPTNNGPSSLGGSAWFNHDDFNNPVRGNYAWMGILHETGHALGLKHGHEFPLPVSADRDSTEYTVMTYRSFPGDDADGYNNETWGYPQTLMMYDIAGLQQMYGANYGFNAGNSVYSWSSTTGEMSINGVGQGAPGNGAGGSANRVFMTIWDGGGTDTYDMSNYTNATTIDLRPGEWSQTSSTQLANLGSGHIARGNVANALLYQGNPASLIENAIGGSGDDTLYANQAANQLTGNGGTDSFRWTSASHAGTGALADTITDFQHNTAERINLSEVDAVAGTSANEAFTFIGTSAFHNVAGELRYETIGGHAHVFADTDGNGVADMEIIVNNVPIVSASDFVF